MRRSIPFVVKWSVMLAGMTACGGEDEGACVAGASGCACDVGNVCSGSLVCDTSTNTCEGTRSVALPAIDRSARSCEVLLEDDGASVVGARFDGSVDGVSIRQAPRTAVTFHAKSDSPIASSAVRVELVGAGGMTIGRTRCFDGDGQTIPGGGIATGG